MTCLRSEPGGDTPREIIEAARQAGFEVYEVEGESRTKTAAPVKLVNAGVAWKTDCELFRANLK